MSAAETPVIVNPDQFLRVLRVRRPHRTRVRPRPNTLCCADCIHGNHRACSSKTCGCVCYREFKSLGDLSYPTT